MSLLNDTLNTSTNISSNLAQNKTNNFTCESKIENVSEANVSGEILLMMLLLSLSLGGGHYLKKLKLKYISEPFFATIVGLIAGAILAGMENVKYINNITTAYVKFFLILLLPPIIFESAYNMKKKEFFKNVGTILIYAFLGTFISIVFISLALWGISNTGIFQTLTIRESLAFGSLISATDPVAIISAFKEYTTDPNFFQLVYGESILNDAVSIVFYDTCTNFSGMSVVESIFKGMLQFFVTIIGSTLLGYFIGFLTAVFLKSISGRVKQIEKIEISLMVILPWVSYLTAQMLGLSGIVSLLFNGVAHATYTKPNLTDWSKITIKTSYEGVSYIFETLIFIFLGIGFFSFHHPYGELSFPFVLILLIIILIGRLLNIVICSKIANISRNNNYIDNKKQFFLWFAGIRGAMAFALSIKSKIDFPQAGPIFLVLTLIIASFTIFYSTLFLEYTLKKCELTNICEADNFEESEFRQRSLFENFKYKIEGLNNAYLMPCVLREKDDPSQRSSLQMQEVRFNSPKGQPDKNKQTIKNDNNSNNDFINKKDGEDVTID